MTSVTARIEPVPWWKEPTKDQWTAWWAACLGWALDTFDFTILLLIMLPISQEFGVPLTAVTARVRYQALAAAAWSHGIRVAGRPREGEGPKAPAPRGPARRHK